MKMLTILLLMEGKNLAVFLTLSLRVSGMLKQEQITQGKKTGFRSTKSIKGIFLDYLIESRKYHQSTLSGSRGLFPPESTSRNSLRNILQREST